MASRLLAGVLFRLDAGAHQFLVDRSPIGRRVDGHLFGVGGAAAVGTQRVEDAPQVLVDFQSFQQCRFTVKNTKRLEHAVNVSRAMRKMREFSLNFVKTKKK